MNARELRIGRLYAYPTGPGPWFRAAVPARVMSRGPRRRVLVLLPDGVPATPLREEVPRAALVWVDAATLVSTWEEWPRRAAAARADLTAVVARSVAAIGGLDAPVLEGPGERTPWWSRPVQELLRPPALRPVEHHAPARRADVLHEDAR
ncbi:MAG: hypothetical protein GC157_12425 [Frankiales bacterium]|nr:hypothetical protein [Frankiales bacterium]